MHVPLPAVLDAELPQEPLPPRMPFGVRGQPCRGRPGVADLQQPEGDAVELLAAWELRPARGAPWIGYTYLDDSGRTKPAFLNSTGAMYPKVECSLKLLYQCT